MLWVTLILGQLLVFFLVVLGLLIRHHHFMAASAVFAETEEEDEEEQVGNGMSLAEQMMLANDKDTAVQELVLAQRLRLTKLGLNDELVDNMTFYLYQRLWS